MGENLGPGLLGCIIGFFLAGVVGTAFRHILWHWGRIAAIRNPQIIVQSTDKTPLQVLVDGCKSLFILLGIFILVVIFLLGAISVFGWDEISTFVRSIAQP